MQLVLCKVKPRVILWNFRESGALRKSTKYTSKLAHYNNKMYFICKRCLSHDLGGTIRREWNLFLELL